MYSEPPWPAMSTDVLDDAKYPEDYSRNLKVLDEILNKLKIVSIIPSTSSASISGFEPAFSREAGEGEVAR
jgi:hypothetical protein